MFIHGHGKMPTKVVFTKMGRQEALVELLNQSLTLHEKYPYLDLFRSVFSRIQTEYGEILCISPYLIRMQENVDKNNSKYGHFSRSVS